MRVALLTVNYYSGRFTELLVRSVAYLNPEHSIKFHVFDNGSSDGSLRFFDSEPGIEVRVISQQCPHSQPSFSHGFGVDSLMRDCAAEDFDLVLLIDTDCFSLEPRWLDRYLDLIASKDLDLLGAPAYCPSASEEHRYLWPGFTFFSIRAVATIRELGLSFVPDRNHPKPNDSGQLVSDTLLSEKFEHEFLTRTEPMSIGSVKLEKWSIDSRIHHFFAASMARSTKNPFAFIYGDRHRGRYITKRFQAWRLFRQPEIRKIMRLP